MHSFTLGLILSLSGLQTTAPTVTLEANTWTLGELVSELGRQSERPLLLTPSMRSFKVSAFLKQEPVDNVMARLAEVFRAEWRKESGGERLTIPSGKLVAEREYVNAVRTARRAKNEEYLRSVLSWSHLSKTEAQARYDRLIKRTDDATRDGKWKPYPTEAIELHNLISSPEPIRVILQLQGYEAIRRLLAGETLWVATGARGRHALPETMMESFEESFGQDEYITPGRYVFALRVDLSDESLEYLYQRHHPTELTSSRDRWWLNSSRDPQLLILPFAREASEWRRSSSNELRERPIDLRTPAWPSPYSTTFYTASDHLQWLHRASGVPILQEASRRPFRWSRLPRSSNTVGQYLDGFVESGPEWAVRQAGGFILVRRDPTAYWAAGEVAEEVLRPFETRVVAKRHTLQDVAEFASRLTHLQVDWLGRPEAACLRYPAHSLTAAVPALRIWAVLATRQKTKAMTREGLPYLEMPAGAQALFRQALQNPFFTQGRFSAATLTAIASGAALGPIERLSLKVDMGGFASPMGGLFPLDDAPDLVQKLNQAPYPTVRFSIGLPEAPLVFYAELPPS